jgi:phosphatidylethanolamine-binding protein (PEBP) family uncharacterized protein
MRMLVLGATVLASVIAGTSANALTVAVDWTGTAKCFDTQSPVFKLKGVPKSAKQLRFAMMDLNAPNYPHGGGTVSYSGQAQLSKGAFRYTGPCPPDGVHQYHWTVEALDASGQTIDSGKVTAPFPPR